MLLECNTDVKRIIM